jgi:hypothetical protein
MLTGFQQSMGISSGLRHEVVQFLLCGTSAHAGADA